jgi:Phosphoglucomutase
MSFPVKEIATKPFEGQKPGTSGLRKRSEFHVGHPWITILTLRVFQSQSVPTGGRKCIIVTAVISDLSLQHYTENFVQAIFDSIDPIGSTLVIGGDGRYFSLETVQTILKIGSANGVHKFIVGKDSILSTPAASDIIRKRGANGGILLTASHNPGGPDNDFGIKYNVKNGGPAPENVTNMIYEKTKTIQKYKVIEAPAVSSYLYSLH